MRPVELAGDDSPKWDVFRHLVERLELGSGGPVEILVDLDVGVPLRRPEDVARCLQVLRSGPADVVVTAFVPDRNPYFNMVEPAGDGSVRIVKDPVASIHNRQSAPIVWALSPAVYAIRRECLWRVDHWSKARLEVVELPRERAWDIDAEIDLAFLEFLLSRSPGARCEP
jgi:CMP-N-acetylneuraminic acid synthetase